MGDESTRYHRLNVVICKLVTGLTRNPLVRAYPHSSTLEHLPDLEESLKRFKDPIVLRDLNMDFGEARSLRSQRVADLLAEYGIIDLVRNFR